jgi:hypothetical protein
MISIVAAFGIACIAYGLVAVAFDPVAAVVPALFAFAVALYLLLRRASKGVERGLAGLEELLRAGKVAEASQRIEATRDRWALWMPLLRGQLTAQLGMLDYVQLRFDEALPKLIAGKWRNWIAQGCIGAIHHRAGRKEQAHAALVAATKAGKKEPLAWILRAVLLHRDDRREDALAVLAEGLTHLPGQPQLTDLQAAIANKKRVETARFGQGWYQFYPEELAARMRQAGPVGPRGPNFGPGFRGPRVSKQARRGR